MSNQITSKFAESSEIKQLNVVSNSSGKTVEVRGGTIRLEYRESILQDSIRATIVFADTGNSVENKTALDGLPIVGEEKVGFKIADNNETEIGITLYVNKVTPLHDDTTKSLVQLDLTSKEYIMNEKVRLNSRFDGKVSDHIEKILTDKSYLGTTKKRDIEETLNNYNFIGNYRKPYYALNWLSKIAISSQNQKKGSSAGYFFFETSDGFKFRSIDGLFSQSPKKKIIYNQTSDFKGNIPTGYDIKAIEYTKDNRINVQNKLMMGAYSTRTILFDPFNCYYEVITKTAEETEKSLKLGGKNLPKFNPEFLREGGKEFSRTHYYLIDRGTLPDGSGTGKEQLQLEKSKEPNFDPRNVLNQSTMRYNQMFASQCEVTIPGDFSLHAGDVIELDVPELQTDTKNDDVNKQSGGLYIIAELCQLITTNNNFTKLNLVRDSFGKRPSSIPL